MPRDLKEGKEAKKEATMEARLDTVATERALDMAAATERAIDMVASGRALDIAKGESRMEFQTAAYPEVPPRPRKQQQQQQPRPKRRPQPEAGPPISSTPKERPASY